MWQSFVLKVLHERLILPSEFDPPLGHIPFAQLENEVAVLTLCHRYQLMLLELPSVERHYPQIPIRIQLKVVDLKLAVWSITDLNNRFHSADLLHLFLVIKVIVSVVLKHVRVLGGRDV